MPSISTRSASVSSTQVSFHTGSYMHKILYGIELYLYFKTMDIFLVRRSARSRRDIFFATFSTVMFVLITVFVAIQAVSGQEQLSLPDPEEQAAHFETPASYASTDVSATICLTLQLMTDSMMIYRCQTLWDSRRIIIIPAILWLISIALGVLAAWSASLSLTNFFTGISYELGLTFYTISVFLQTTLTSMICYRLVSHARKLKEVSGTEYAAPYFSVIRLLVESVLPLTLTGIAYLVSYGVGSSVVNGLSEVYIVLVCVSPQMLILRVAEGKGWEKESMSMRSTVRFGGGATTDGGLSAPDIQLRSIPRLVIPHSDSDRENRI